MDGEKLTVRWQDCGVLVVGTWLLVSPWLINFNSEIEFVWTESSYVAVALIAIALFTLIVRNIWSEFLVFAIGVWMIASPLTSKLEIVAPDQRLHQIMMVDSVLSSVLLLVCSSWAIFEDGRLQKLLGKRQKDFLDDN